MEEGTPTAAPKQGAPFYRIRMTVKIDKGQTDSWTLVYVPSQGLLRTNGEFGFEWLATTPRGQRGFDRVVQGLEPQPASALRGVGADGGAAGAGRRGRAAARPRARARRRLPVDRAPDPGRPAARGRRVGGAPARAARPVQGSRRARA